MIDRLYIAAAPAPLILLLLFLRYTGHLQGWGAWAAAPMIIPVIVLSGLMGVYGINRAARGSNRRHRVFLAGAAMLSGAVAIWFAVEALIRLF